MYCKICKEKLFLHPLTKLPGSNQIYQEIEKRINKPFALLFLDIDNFKPYNDKYGFYKGDLVINHFACIIKNFLSKNDFLGHIGGDDFIILSTPLKACKIAQNICDTFDQTIKQFYSQEDIILQKIKVKNRQNKIIEYPIMTISIAIATNEYIKLKNTAHVSQIAAELKNYAKTKPNGEKSNFVTERRRS